MITIVFNQDIMTQATTQIFDDNARAVTHYVATKTPSNITGSPSIAYDSGTSTTLCVIKTSTSFDWTSTGLDEYGEYFIMDYPDHTNLAKDDKIVVGDETLIIQSVNTWNSRGTDIYLVASAALLT